MRVTFGSFTLDSDTREILRADEPLRLSTKAFDLLQLLLESAPRLVAKRELLDHLWPATYIGDGALATLVAELRDALGDDARSPQFIRTVYGLGYAFCGELRRAEAELDAQGEFRLLWGGREIHLSSGSNILGRDKTAVAWVDDPSISRLHAVIHVLEQDATIEDLDSKNGTFVGGQRVKGCHPLHDGDTITLGRVPMTFRLFRNGTPTESVTSA